MTIFVPSDKSTLRELSNVCLRSQLSQEAYALPLGATLSITGRTPHGSPALVGRGPHVLPVAVRLRIRSAVARYYNSTTLNIVLLVSALSRSLPHSDPSLSLSHSLWLFLAFNYGSLHYTLANLKPPRYAHIHTYIHTYMYTYMYIYMCVLIWCEGGA